MSFRIISPIAAGIALVAISELLAIQGRAQTPAALIAAANGTTMVANGIAITLTPGSPPTISAVSTEDGSPIAISKSVRFIGKHGQIVDPSSITLMTRFQPICDTTATGRVIQQVVVDRD
ncbi:MAG: hypothetical protein QOG67_173 [Verrucomicrobiota bacterium]|jgi:hypothetical protein